MEDEESDHEDESDDDDDWITPSNLKEAQETLGEVEIEENAPKVACVTSDFAMQVIKFDNKNFYVYSLNDSS